MKKYILDNNIEKIYENFIKNYNHYNVDKNFKPNFNKSFFGDYEYRNLKLSPNTHFKFYHEWADYYIRHSIEFKLFLRYLKENNLYRKVLNNLHKQDNFNFNNYFLNFKFIDELLCWGESKEGHSFWAMEDDNWNNFFDKIKYIIKYDK